MGMPTLIGAGVGALGSALTGNNPFKGALLGGGLGTGYGGISSLLSGGGFMEGAFPFMTQAAPAAAESVSLAAPTVDISNAAMLGAPQSGNWAMTPYGTLINKDYYANVLGTPIYTGGQGFLTNAYDEVKNMLPNISSSDVGNALGAASIAQKYAQRPPIPQAPAGGVSRGNPPSGSAVQELIATMKPEPKKRISLLVG